MNRQPAVKKTTFRNKLHDFLHSSAVQSILASLICILLGLLVGFIVLLIINPKGAPDAILAIIKNYMKFNKAETRMENLGNTLVKTAPLILCSLSILFCYKVGLFNIGAAGQYTIGAGVALFAALGLKLPWWLCILLAMAAGAALASISGVLKAFCNVNEVISGIMLNWISLYTTNIILTQVKNPTSHYTLNIKGINANGLIPSLGLGALFNHNEYVTIALPLTLLIAVAIWIILNKTRFGYELKATGFNRHAAKYCGMAEKKNMILSLAIGGALAGLGAAFFYLTDMEQWSCGSSSLPAMGFNGIAAAFLGGLNPIGAIFSSYFIQHITIGGSFVDTTMYSSQITDLICAIIIYLCGFVLFLKRLLDKKPFAHKKQKKTTDDAVGQNKEGGIES